MLAWRPTFPYYHPSARSIATMLGEAMPRDAAEETAAVWGMITADLPADVREHRIDVVNALADDVLTFEQLSATARTVGPRLRAVVREFRPGERPLTEFVTPRRFAAGYAPCWWGPRDGWRSVGVEFGQRGDRHGLDWQLGVEVSGLFWRASADGGDD
jgi:hypothetical protein